MVDAGRVAWVGPTEHRGVGPHSPEPGAGRSKDALAIRCALLERGARGVRL